MRNNTFTISDCESIFFSISLLSLLYYALSRKSPFALTVCAMIASARVIYLHNGPSFFEKKESPIRSCSRFIPVEISANSSSFLVELRQKNADKSDKWISKFERTCEKYITGISHDEKSRLKEAFRRAKALKLLQVNFATYDPRTPGRCGEHVALMMIPKISQFIRNNWNWTQTFPLQVYQTRGEKWDHQFVVTNGYGRELILSEPLIRPFYRQLARKTNPASILDTWIYHESGGICSEVSTVYEKFITSGLDPELDYYFKAQLLTISFDFAIPIEIYQSFPTMVRKILKDMRKQLEESIVDSEMNHRTKFGNKYLLPSPSPLSFK